MRQNYRPNFTTSANYFNHPANGMQKLAFSGYSHKNLNAKKAPTNVDAQ
jgi:hypothetical protein